MPSETITLYQFMPMPQDEPQVSSSPFCVKLEAYLILTGRPYSTAAGQPPFAPTKSVPYVAYQGEKIGDSQVIVDRLEGEKAGLYRVLDKNTLSAAQEAVSKEILDLVENKLYFSLVYSRFVMDDGWAHQEAEVRYGLPFFLRCCLTGRIRREQVEKCARHGCTTDVSAFKNVHAWIHRVSQVLGDKPYLFGDAPHIADCSLYGFLVIARANQNANPMTTAIRKDQRLMHFTERMTRLLKK